MFLSGFVGDLLFSGSFELWIGHVTSKYSGIQHEVLGNDSRICKDLQCNPFIRNSFWAHIDWIF